MANSSLPRRSFSRARPNRAPGWSRSASTARSYRATTSLGFPPRAATVAARCVQVLGRLLDGPGEVVQHGHGLGGLAGIAEGLGAGQRALAGVVAGLLRRLVALHGPGRTVGGRRGSGQVEVGHGPAVALLEDLDGPIAAAQQVEAGPQADHARRGGLFLGLQLRHGIAEDGVIGPVADDGRFHVADFLRAEGSVDQDCLPQVEFDALHHGGCSPKGFRDLGI